jgi:capsular polysaccharide biosynthesis protein/Mrp family chromosome partitioning ATPase
VAPDAGDRRRKLLTEATARIAAIPAPAALTSPQPALRQYVDVVRRQFWLIAITTMSTVVVAAALVSRQDPVYQASTKVVVGQGGGVFEPEFGGAVQPFTQTMTNLLESDIIARRVIEKLGLEKTPEAFLDDLDVSSRPESSVLEVTYQDTDKTRAVDTLAEVGTVFTQLIEERLSARLRRESLPAVTVSIFDPAHLETDPVSPKPTRSLAFATALGLALGLVLAFARDSLDERIRGRLDAERAFRAPVVGALPSGVRGATPLLVGGQGRRTGELIEALRLLRANLLFSEAGIRGRTIAVTSGLASEGKTTVVANLGVLLALAGHNVICVDADPRRPKLHEHLNLSPDGAGLADVTDGRVSLTDALREVVLGTAPPPEAAGMKMRLRLSARGAAGPPDARGTILQEANGGPGRLRVLLANHSPGAPHDLLTSDRVAELVERLIAHADYVIFDTPPLLEVGEGFPLALVADTVLVVAREGRTTVSTAEAVRLTLEGLGVSKVSIILTGSNIRRAYSGR